MAHRKQVETLALGPWPRGVADRLDESHREFEAWAGRQPKIPNMLRKAVNVDLDVDGGVTRRKGRTKRVSFSSARSLWSERGEMLLAEGTNLLRVRPDFTTEVVATEIGTGAVSYCAIGGNVFWMTSTARGAIIGGTNSAWGLEAPAVLGLSAGTGGLRAGIYRVALTGETESGLEGGALKEETISLLDSSKIIINSYSSASNINFINIYCSEADGEELYFVKQIPNGGNLVIDQVGRSTDLLETQFYSPPPLGHLIAGHHGRMLVAHGTQLYVSEALGMHWFDLRTSRQSFPASIRMIAPEVDGVWIAADKLYWLSGGDPLEWSVTEVDEKQVSFGAPLRVSGSKFPKLQFEGLVNCWVSEDGLVVGLPGGRIVKVTEELVAMNKWDSASVSFREEDGLRQVLMALRKKSEESRFGMSDRATCSVIKASAYIGRSYSLAFSGAYG